MDKQDIKAQKMEILTLSFNQLRKNKSIGYFGYNFYKQNKDKLKEVKIKGDDGKSENLLKDYPRWFLSFK